MGWLERRIRRAVTALAAEGAIRVAVVDATVLRCEACSGRGRVPCTHALKLRSARFDSEDLPAMQRMVQGICAACGGAGRIVVWPREATDK